MLWCVSRLFFTSSARNEVFKFLNCFHGTMDPWGKWEFSPESEERLKILCKKLNGENSSEISKAWLELLNYSSDCKNSQMEVDVSPVDPKEDEIISGIKEAIENDEVITETVFSGLSMNSLSRIFISISEVLDEFRFCTFCKCIASWSSFVLIETAMKSVVVPKLKEIKEASGCVIFSLKKLSTSKPEQFCQNVIIPLLSDETFQFTDVDLLSSVFPSLPVPQRDMIILFFTTKSEFNENDWLLLLPLIKDLSTNSLLQLLECIQKFSYEFTKSQVFGRFLVSFCKNFNLIGKKDVILEVVKKHETLLKNQALKHLSSV